MQGTVKPALLLALVAAPLLVHGSWSSISVGTDAVYKCEQGGQVTFQDTSCPPGATQTPARPGDNAKQKAQEQANSQPSEMEAAASQEDVLARFRLSDKTPFLPRTDGGLEVALNAPDLPPGEAVFIVGAKGSGNDAWYRAFRNRGGKRDYGFISRMALLGQDESIPLDDWIHALDKTSDLKKAAQKTDGFTSLPEHDVDAFCAAAFRKLSEKADIDRENFRDSCLKTEQQSRRNIKSRFANLPLIIRKTCAIEALNSYESLKSCVDIKQRYSGNALTFPG